MAAISTGLDALLSPLAGDTPTGSDPRGESSASGIFQELKELRSRARRIERDSVDAGEEPLESIPLWREIGRLAETLLSEQSKDIEVTCYLIEAWVRLEGLASLGDGFLLLRELCDRYWDALYPRPEAGEDPVERVQSINVLNRFLPDALTRLPITGGASVGPFATWQHQAAASLHRLDEREREKRIESGGVTPEIIRRAIAETDPAFFRTLVANTARAAAELQSLGQVLENRCGIDAPNLSAISDTLAEIDRSVRELVPSLLEPAVAPSDGAAVASGGAVAGESPIAGGRFRSRDEALRTLLHVAEFFEQLDPQSLLAVQLRRLERLGRMSPAEYFTEILEDESSRNQMFKLVGILPPKSSD